MPAMKRNITLFIIEIIIQALYDYYNPCDNPYTREDDLINQHSAKTFFDGNPEESHYRFYLGLLGVSTKDGLPTPQEIAGNLSRISATIDDLTAKRFVEKKYNKARRKRKAGFTLPPHE